METCYKVLLMSVMPFNVVDWKLKIYENHQFKRKEDSDMFYNRRAFCIYHSYLTLYKIRQIHLHRFHEVVL